jgi:hypothetical protein
MIKYTISEDLTQGEEAIRRSRLRALKDRSAGYRFKDRQVRNRRDDRVLDHEEKPAYDAELSQLNQLRVRLSSHSRSCARFISKPPIDPSVRANEHKRLNEIILTSIIMQADELSNVAHETLKQRRDIVSEAQLLLASLENAAKRSKGHLLCNRSDCDYVAKCQSEIEYGQLPYRFNFTLTYYL